MDIAVAREARRKKEILRVNISLYQLLPREEEAREGGSRTKKWLVAGKTHLAVLIRK